MSLSLHIQLDSHLGVRVRIRPRLAQSPVMRSLPVPAGALDGVVELAALSAPLALAYAHGSVRTFNLPVMNTLSSFNSILSHRAILSSNFRTPVIHRAGSPLVYRHILHIHVPDIQQPRTQQDIVVELLHHLHRPAGNAPHSEDGYEQVFGNVQQVVYRS